MSNPKKLVDYDVRVRERNLKSGVLTKELVDEHLASLPDLSANAQTVDVQPPGVPHEEPAKPEVKAEASPTPPVQPPVPPAPPAAPAV